MKLAATDFDGTFAPHRQPVPASNIEAVAKWQAAGHKFGICTGRGLSLIEFEIRKYPELHPDYLVCNNGAVVVNAKREFLASLCFPADTLRGLLELPIVRQTKNPMRLLTETDMYLLDTGSTIEFGLVIPMKSLSFAEAEAMEKVVQISMRCESVEEAEAVTVEVTKAYPDLIGNINRNYIDFNLKDANKRDGLRRLLQKTGWQPEEILFIGDDQNDLPAVKYFHGYTVETAEPFMKEAATKVYSSVGAMLLAHL